MPRLARLPAIPFGWYYVVLHSVKGRKIITHQSDLAMALKLLRSTLRERGGRLHAGYIAESEMHLALQAGEGPVSAITGNFQHEYARIFNRANYERGSLFRLHNHILLFQHQRWLVPLVHFIHWIRRLERPDDYRDGLWWSSDAAYRGLEKQDWLTTNVTLRMMTRGTYNRHVHDLTYRQLGDQMPDSRHTHLFKQGSPEDPRLLGDASFIADVRRLTGERSSGRTSRERGPEVDIPPVMMRSIEQFHALCDVRLPPRHARAWRRLVTYDNLRSRSRRRPLPMLRALIVSYLIEHDIARLQRAARFFNCSSRSVSARRRRFYGVLFREWFGATPEILFGPRRDGDGKEPRPAFREASRGGLRRDPDRPPCSAD